MIRLLTAFLLFASFSAVADDLRTFSDGQVINADDFNHNFQKLEQDIADIPEGPQGPMGNPGNPGPAGPIGPAGADGVAAGLNCTTDQIIKWDGTNDVWVCATDPFAGLNCDVGDQLRMGSGGWECRAEPITASVIEKSWVYVGAPFAGIRDYFESLNNVETQSVCVPDLCNIQIFGVDDHTNCVAQVTGDAVPSGANVDIQPFPDFLSIGDFSTWTEGQEVYINISCPP